VHGPLNDAQRDALLRVQRSQRHLLALINNVLNLARIETGNIEYSLGEVALVPLLADIKALVAPLFAAKNVGCETIMPSDEPPEVPLVVRADSEKVRQIIINLLTNALKFTPSGGRVTVEAGCCSDSVSMACVRVSDTGIGIAASKLDAIFEAFVQLAGPSGSQRDGVGLGLAISRDLARGMGGDIAVVSAEGEGTTFTLSLPRIG
jgi:signal transduction histidine kinase